MLYVWVMSVLCATDSVCRMTLWYCVQCIMVKHRRVCEAVSVGNGHCKTRGPTEMGYNVGTPFFHVGGMCSRLANGYGFSCHVSGFGNMGPGFSKSCQRLVLMFGGYFHSVHNFRHCRYGCVFCLWTVSPNSNMYWYFAAGMSRCYSHVCHCLYVRLRCRMSLSAMILSPILWLWNAQIWMMKAAILIFR